VRAAVYTWEVLAALWEPVLVGTLVVATVLMSAMVVGGLLVWRYSRRKWRAFHSHGAVIGAMALWEATAAGGYGRRAPSSPEDVYRWAPRRVRKELWRSVDRADAAVRAASDAGAPTASLPSLCRRLNDAAVGLDRVLRIETSGSAPAEVVAQVIEVIQAASDVQRAAVASASDATGQQVRDLVRDADHEIQCLDAGLASAQAALPRRRR
jgi:hypothetical protein